ncbi:MAG: glycogen-binding domain-containing protein [Phycisphaerae bacterium]|nr:glycogen-binding domain-containing protein [Phycisphaerae bacterium]
MVTPLPSGELEFKVFAPNAASVEVLGSFTGWSERPVAMRNEGGGWWTARAAVTPGDHDFQYRIDGNSWMTDYAAHGVRLNQLGEWVSRLAVPKAA